MRLVLTGLCLIACIGAASAQTPAPPAVLDQVYSCASVTGESERLACYDGAVGRLRAAQASGDLVAVDRNQATEIRRDAFGFNLPTLPRLFGGNGNAAEIDNFSELTMEIQRVAHRGDGKSVFVMTNGQTWVQTEVRGNPRARAGETVTIRQAALGSFMMSFEHGQALRVRRQE